MAEEDWEEEEHLVVIKLQGVIDNEFLYSCESANCRLLVCLDSALICLLCLKQKVKRESDEQPSMVANSRLLLGIDTDEPVLQIGNYTFIGEFKESLGTHVLFEELESNDAEGSKRLKYKCNTTKTLEMSRVFLVEKEKEKEKEQIPGPSSDPEEHQQQETTDSEG